MKNPEEKRLDEVTQRKLKEEKSKKIIFEKKAAHEISKKME